MTKEKLRSNILEYLGYCNSETIDRINENIDAFFDSNVCIPKGANRHPYADVLHKWVEGTEIEARYLKNTSFVWEISVTLPSLDYEYRIKPIKPVYEWQWCVIMDDGTASIYGYHTEETIADLFVNRTKFKIEVTKRECR